MFVHRSFLLVLPAVCIAPVILFCLLLALRFSFGCSGILWILLDYLEQVLLDLWHERIK